MSWPTVPLGELARPKQWPILSRAEMAPIGYPLFSANGQIGFAETYTHEHPTLLVGCRGSCGSLHVTPPKAYANGNAMALDSLDTRRIDLRFLFRYLEKRGFEDVISGSSQPQITRQTITRVVVPLPPLEEQRRIAAILDQADALRRKRKEASALLARLVDSLFDVMFGRKLSKWPKTRFANLLAEPLRNGVSPASDGIHMASVLTLSAVTGERFDESATKVAYFKSDPPQNQRVCSGDILICRGNGNRALVGRGFLPRVDVPEVVFPDTVIAGRINGKVIEPVFLEYLWNSEMVRRQIQSMARTTNGTFKVNQSMLESVELIDPPIVLQQFFAENLQKAEEHRERILGQTKLFDALFASLQDRAFRGEL